MCNKNHHTFNVFYYLLILCGGVAVRQGTKSAGKYIYHMNLGAKGQSRQSAVILRRAKQHHTASKYNILVRTRGHQRTIEIAG